MGLFNNYVTLKLPFFETPTPHYHVSSRIDHKTPFTLRQVWHGYTPFIIYFSFLKLKKPQRYAPTHDTSIHVFKQLNQIARFK